MQQYADIYSLPRHSTCFGCHSTHHQEYYKLYLLPLVYVMVMVPLLPSTVGLIRTGVSGYCGGSRYSL